VAKPPPPPPEPVVELLEDDNDDLCHVCGLVVRPFFLPACLLLAPAPVLLACLPHVAASYAKAFAAVLVPATALCCCDGGFSQCAALTAISIGIAERGMLFLPCPFPTG
jgi:hypothetical protein